MQKDKEKKKKKLAAALKSRFMLVPHMPAQVASYLLDVGYTDVFQLRGRAAESIFEEIKKLDFLAEAKIVLPALRLAIYFSENSENPDRRLLNLQAWAEA
ncbi:MAG: hypothetical protein LUD52_07440 [Opitutae bacterium]|nr:hypothetical protein [Opitutae bacterium]